MPCSFAVSYPAPIIIIVVVVVEKCLSVVCKNIFRMNKYKYIVGIYINVFIIIADQHIVL